MSQFFISYFREDQEYAFLVKDEVESRLTGAKGWIDTSDVRGGKEWLDQIQKAIRDSFALILIVAPEAMKRQWVMYEWIFAEGAGVSVIPVKFKPTNLSEFHERIKYLQYRDFSDEHSRDWDSLIEDLKQAREDRGAVMGLPFGATDYIKDKAKQLGIADRETCFGIIDDLRGSGDEHIVELLKVTAEKHHMPSVRDKAEIAYARKSHYYGIHYDRIRQIALRREPGYELHFEAISILGNVGSDEAVAILGEVMDIPDTPNNISVFVATVEALVASHYPRAIAHIVKAFKYGNDFVSYLDAALIQMERQLGTIRNEEAEQAFFELYDIQHEMSSNASYVFWKHHGNIGGSASVQKIIDFLRRAYLDDTFQKQHYTYVHPPQALVTICCGNNELDGRLINEQTLAEIAALSHSTTVVQAQRDLDKVVNCIDALLAD